MTPLSTAACGSPASAASTRRSSAHAAAACARFMSAIARRALGDATGEQASPSLPNGVGLFVSSPEISPKDDCSEYVSQFDRLIDNLKQLCEREGQFVLRDALDKEDAQRKVEEWFVLSASPETLYKKISQVMKTKGSEQISSWNFFSKAIDAMISISR